MVQGQCPGAPSPSKASAEQGVDVGGRGAAGQAQCVVEVKSKGVWKARGVELEPKLPPLFGVCCRVGWGGWGVLLITITSSHSPSEVGEG